MEKQIKNQLETIFSYQPGFIAGSGIGITFKQNSKYIMKNKVVDFNKEENPENKEKLITCFKIPFQKQQVGITTYTGVSISFVRKNEKGLL